MKIEQEFMYKNVEIQIVKFFGYNYHFYYANIDYYGHEEYTDINFVRFTAMNRVDQIIRKDQGDDLEIGA